MSNCVLRVVWPALLVGSVLLGGGCRDASDPSARLRTTLESMEATLEAGEVGDFMRYVADDFIGADGRLDRRGLGLLVRRERLARQTISVQRFDTAIELVGPDRARAHFRALATGGSGLLPEQGRLWRVETGWRLERGDWRLISATWTPAL